MRAARKPPDADHPYGHRKFETLAAAGDLRLPAPGGDRDRPRRRSTRLASPAPPGDHAGSRFAVMIATLAVNLWVVRYEAARGAAATAASCCSPTRSTRAATSSRRSACWSRWPPCALGYPMLDPIGGVAIAMLIARTSFEIARDTSGILSDRVVIDEEDIREGRDERARGARLPSHPHARAAGSRLPGPARLVPGRRRGCAEAHAVSHVVKDRLMAAVPADRRRDHPHRAAAAGRSQLAVRRWQLAVGPSRGRS